LLSLTWAGLAPADRASFAWRLPLLDHLVGALLEEPRHVDPERLRRLEIDHELDLGRLLDRDVGGPSALKDAVDVAGKLAEGVADVRPVGQETAYILKGTGDLQTVRALLGHARIESTARYLRLKTKADPIEVCRAFDI
jgi:integrase